MKNGQRWIALLGSLCAAFLVAAGLLGYRLATQEPEPLNYQELLQDPTVRDEVMAELLQRVSGVWDTHNDPAVGRTLQSGLAGRNYSGVKISSNRLGMRERDYATPKEPGTLRVALLGDSFVMGYGVEASERMGVLLQRYLVQRAGEEAPKIEVLHLGVSGWNIVVECAYLRRQLSLLQPDLVIQLTVRNDLNDSVATRGFGAMASFTSQYRGRGDNAVLRNFPSQNLGHKLNHLNDGLDHESLSRYGEAGAAIARLAEAIERTGGRYLVLLQWSPFNALAERYLTAGLADDQKAFISAQFSNDKDYWITPTDGHWNAAGNEVAAKLMYALIQQRGLLPALTLPAWKEANGLHDEILLPGLEEALAEPPYERWLESSPILDSLDFTALSAEVASHVYTGIDKQSVVGVFCSFVLAAHPGGNLRLQGAGLARPEIDGARVAVAVDGVPAGAFTVAAASSFDVAFPLPQLPEERRFVTVILEAEDYAYVGKDLQGLAAFRLDSAAIEPPTLASR